MCEDSSCNSEVTPCLIPRSRSSTAFAIASAVLFGFLDFFGKKKCIYINIDLISSNSTFFLIFTWIKCIVVYNFKIYSHKCLSSIHFEDIFEYDSTE